MEYAGYRIAGKPIYVEGVNYFYVISFHNKGNIARARSKDTDFWSMVRKIGNRYAVLQRLPNSYRDKIVKKVLR